VVIGDADGNALAGHAMPASFRLSDYGSRVFHADENGVVLIPKGYAFESLSILCKGYTPQLVRRAHFNSSDPIEVTMRTDPDPRVQSDAAIDSDGDE